MAEQTFNYSADRETLADFLARLSEGSRTVPNVIELPAPLVTLLGTVWTATEQSGVEHGCQLIFNRKTKTFGNEVIVPGLDRSLNIPVSNDPGNFGDLHGHPSKQLGYDGGFPAHSSQDLRKFEQTAAKPFFFQFVVCGERVYALAQINGISSWVSATTQPNRSTDKFLTDFREAEVDVLLVAKHDAVGGDKNYVAIAAATNQSDDVEPEEVALIDAVNNRAGKAGKKLEKVTKDWCANFAKTYNYVFYEGDLDPIGATKLVRQG
nr:hypothetical protein [Micromonospora sp. DSM 115978]